MTEPSPRTRGRPKDASKRDAILIAARGLLLDCGVDVTTGEVAAAAGVAKATLYANFKDKDELIEAVIRRESEQVIADDFIQVRPGATFAKVLRSFGAKYVRFVNQTDVSGWDRLIAHGAKRIPQLPHRFYEAGPGRWNRLLMQLLTTGVDLGCLRPLNNAQAAEDLTALWMGSTSLKVKLGVGKPMSEKAILAKVDHGIDVFKTFYGAAIGDAQN
ncbi:TetR/AcrR family transcriptional regulator C-terminal domain-containing protein [Xylophilus sp. GW821-FHT01B05]